MDLDTHLSAIALGDAGAFGRWLAGAEPRLRDSLRPFAARVDTEALLQETLLRAWQVAPRHAPDGRPNSLLRLSMRIARNLCIDNARRMVHRKARSLDQHVARLGYAGLSSFTHLEPEVAKLDMSLIRGVGVDPRRQHIVEAMTRLSAASSGW